MMVETDLEQGLLPCSTDDKATTEGTEPQATTAKVVKEEEEVGKLLQCLCTFVWYLRQFLIFAGYILLYSAIFYGCIMVCAPKYPYPFTFAGTLVLVAMISLMEKSIQLATLHILCNINHATTKVATLMWFLFFVIEIIAILAGDLLILQQLFAFFPDVFIK
jgi:hypothetical protein